MECWDVVLLIDFGGIVGHVFQEEESHGVPARSDVEEAEC